ncbi:MAG: DUF3617 family protein [Hyphomicrobiaceae bacterium]|nr:DUF3617 family protein [Hyphomicrobiaceae bacterium]
MAMVGAGPVSATEDTTLLQAGEYEVRVRLELPHLEDMGAATKVDSICVTDGKVGTRGLLALSDGNPLRKCPASNVRQDGPTLTFDIVCPGSDAAAGAARFTLDTERFEGVIAVKMGGKNMTMIERQSGHRVGKCKSQSPRP